MNLAQQLQKNGRCSVNRMTIAEIVKLLGTSAIDPHDATIVANGDLVLPFKS